MIERTYTQAEVAAAFDAAWQQIVRFPRATVCRHWAACQVLDAMERLDCAPPEYVIAAVVDSDDETALAWERGQ